MILTQFILSNYYGTIPFSVLIRKGPDNRAQLVLLDHGLYETLSERDRRTLCRFYKSILQNDHNAMKMHSNALGVKGL